MSDISRQIWDMKYRLKQPDGTPVDGDIAATWARVALAAARAEAPAKQRDAALQFAGALAGHATHASDPLLPNLVWYGIAPSVLRNADTATALAGKATLPRVRHNIARLLAGQVDVRPELVARLLDTAARAPADVRRDLVTGLAAGLRGWSRATAPAGYAALSDRLTRESDDATRRSIEELDLLFGEGRGPAEVRRVAREVMARFQPTLVHGHYVTSYGLWAAACGLALPKVPRDRIVWSTFPHSW